MENTRLVIHEDFPVRCVFAQPRAEILICAHTTEKLELFVEREP